MPPASQYWQKAPNESPLSLYERPNRDATFLDKSLQIDPECIPESMLAVLHGFSLHVFYCPTNDFTLENNWMIVYAGKGATSAQKGPSYLASMGIYVFKKRVLFNILQKSHPEAKDFGNDVRTLVSSFVYVSLDVIIFYL